MAAFTSNIDITSGGTYNMNITNGEPASQVATDLNGKFANIQQYLQNGLPEVWTGSSLPDSLPNGKCLSYNNNFYYGLNQMCKVTDITSIISSLSYNKSFIVTYIGTGNTIKQINTPFKVRMMIATYVWTKNITSQWYDIYREYNNTLLPSMSDNYIVQSISDSLLTLSDTTNRYVDSTECYYFYYMFA